MADSQPQEPTAASTLLLSGARLADGRTVDVRLGGGRIEAVGTAGSLAPGQLPPEGARVDLSGYLLLPAPAEPHCYAPEELQRRTTEAALHQLGHGATALRTHVHIGDVAGLRSLEGVLQA